MKYKYFALLLQKNKNYAKQESICPQSQTTKQKENSRKANRKVKTRKIRQPIEP